MSFFSDFVGLPLVDVGSVGFSILLPAYRFVRCKFFKSSPEELHIIFFFFDLLRGVAFFPFFILVIQIIDRPLLKDLLEDNSARVTMFLAGIIGGFSVFNADKWLQEHIKTMLTSHTSEQAKQQGHQTAADDRKSS